MPESCFHFNRLRLLLTFPECRLQHLKTVALDIFVGWEAPVERLGLPTGAWGGLKVTPVQTTGADISRQNIFLSHRCFVIPCPARLRNISEMHSSELKKKITQSLKSRASIDQKEKCPSVDVPPC